MQYTDESIILDKSSQGLYLLQRVRDEAHRFAITYHRNLRQKSSIKSQLDSIIGIGKIKKTKLIKKFGSVDNIRKASISEISSITSINSDLAIKIKESLNSK